MATPPIADEVLKERVAAYLAAGRNQVQASHALGIGRSTLQHSLRQAAEKGFLGPMEAPPGMVIKTIAQKAPDGSYVRFGKEPGDEYVPHVGHLLAKDTVQTDAEGRLIQRWSRYKPTDLDPLYVAEKVIEKFSTMTSAATPRPAPLVAAEADRRTLYPRADLHLGLYAWGREAGQNWDLETAVRVYREAMGEVYARSPPTETAIILGGGDFFHANTNEYRTQSGNVLDGDGRTDKVIHQGIELAAFDIDAALDIHPNVIVRYVKGNHDEYAVIALVHALAAWYRNEPRVVVDTSPDLFWWHRFGKVLLGATHGHNIKPAQLAMIMANRCPQDWGETEFRYGHTFHVHHKSRPADELHGVMVETHQSPAAQDSWHWGKGYLSGRSMQSITYHKDRGEHARNTVTL